MLFVGDDWAEDHHDVEIVDDTGRLLARRRLPEGLDRVSRLQALIGEHTPAEWAHLEPGRAAGMVKVGIETDRGPWVAALAAAGYEVFAVNPMSVSRYRERHSTSGAKSDAADAHLLAEIVRVDRAHHRPLAGDTAEGEAIKLTARAHQSLVWDRTRQVLRLRSTLRDFFPAALKAFTDLDAPDTLELLARAPGPDQAARPTKSRIIAALNTQIDQLGTVVAAHFGQHPDAEIYTSQPGLGTILAARVLGEFGDDHHRYRDAKAGKNYAGTSPITRACVKRNVVLARYARTRRLADALQQWAFSSMRGSPGARSYYQQLRARNIGHQAALRQLANRLVGILHGCLKTHTRYDEHTAWAHLIIAAA